MFTELSLTKAAARDTMPLQSRASPRFLCELPHPRHTVPIHSPPPNLPNSEARLCLFIFAKATDQTRSVWPRRGYT